MVYSIVVAVSLSSSMKKKPWLFFLGVKWAILISYTILDINIYCLPFKGLRMVECKV